MSDEKSVLQQGFDLVSEGASAAHAASTKMLEELGFGKPSEQFGPRLAEMATGVLGGTLVALAAPELALPALAIGGVTGLDGFAGLADRINEGTKTIASTADTSAKPTGSDKGASQSAQSSLPSVSIE